MKRLLVFAVLAIACNPKDEQTLDAAAAISAAIPPPPPPSSQVLPSPPIPPSDAGAYPLQQWMKKNLTPMGP